MFQAALKKYQTEQRNKGDGVEKCQGELKKLRKKSQGSKNPQKYSEKELQVGLWLISWAGHYLTGIVFDWQVDVTIMGWSMANGS